MKCACVRLATLLLFLVQCTLISCGIFDCKVGAWSSWSKCSQPCGNEGIRLRTRIMTSKPTWPKTKCIYELRQERSCNRDNCRLCRYGECLTTGTSNKHQCTCDSGFKGRCCEFVNCAAFTCANGGTCSENPKGIAYPCSCPLQYQGLECKDLAPHLRIPTAAELEQKVEISFNKVGIKQWKSNRDRAFKTLVAEAITEYCIANPEECCHGVSRKDGASLFRTAETTQSQVHRIPNFPVLRSEKLVIAYHVLYKSFRLASRCKSAGIPKDALRKAITARRHSISVRIGLTISDVKTFEKATTTAPTTIPTTTPPTATTPSITVPPNSRKHVENESQSGEDSKFSTLELSLLIAGIIVGFLIVTGIGVAIYRHKKKKRRTRTRRRATPEPECQWRTYPEPAAPPLHHISADPPLSTYPEPVAPPLYHTSPHPPPPYAPMEPPIGLDNAGALQPFDWSVPPFGEIAVNM